MSGALGARSLGNLPDGVRRPTYDPAAVGVGIVHLGIGAFHRAHQAVFTDDVLCGTGGNWGIAGVSMRHAAVADSLTRQDNLYTVEILSAQPDYRVVAAVRRALVAPSQRAELTGLLASAQTHIVTLTITEKGYCLGVDGELDFANGAIVHDLAHCREPLSAIGWLAHGLLARYHSHRRPMTIISCDNLKSNGRKLQRAVTAYVERIAPHMLGWLHEAVTFPQTVVDCIVPAATSASIARVGHVLGFTDDACVQREPFSQWVMENRFAGPRPAWESAGAILVDEVEGYGKLKLHVLNCCHSALAYLGLPRGHTYVHEAIADPVLGRFLENLVQAEIMPALEPLSVEAYWRSVSTRFANPAMNHRLAQIAEDGSLKMAERVFPLLIANGRSGAPVESLARVVRCWLALVASQPVKDPQQEMLASWARDGARLDQVVNEPTLFPAEIRGNPRLCDAILLAQP
jgi:fructuronate reductase